MSTRQSVLIIDDDPMIQKLVAAQLKSLDVDVAFADDGQSGMNVASSLQPDLVLLDVGLPDIEGFDVCRQLRDDPLTTEIPVIFLTGSGDTTDKRMGFDLGAVDYITKPFEPGILHVRVRSALRTQALIKALERQASTDELTGLRNRSALVKTLDRAIERTRRFEDYHFAVVVVDIDRFQLINDSLGHAVGDHVLNLIANKIYQDIRGMDRVLRDQATRPDVVARLGADVFGILLEDIESVEAVLEIIHRLQHDLSVPMAVDDTHVSCAISAGIRLAMNDDGTAEHLMRDAEIAMHHAKTGQADSCALFDEQMLEKAKSRLGIEQDLRHVVERGELALHYQPIVDLETGALSSFEALVRWQHPTRGMISPLDFIPIAEETGAIASIGRWVLQTACTQLMDWSRQYPDAADVRMGVNLSKAQFGDEHLVKTIEQALSDSGLDPSRLTLEVTESVVMHDPRQIVPLLERLRDIGVRLSIDDFGTGHSSLASLHRFPVHTLKIDRAFVMEMGDSRKHAAIVQAVITLAQHLGFDVVAEGIEEIEQLVQLQALDCRYGQGYAFSRPVDGEAAASFFTGEHSFSMAA